MMAFAAQLAAAAPQEISNVALAVGSMSWASSSQWKLALLQVRFSMWQGNRGQLLLGLHMWLHVQWRLDLAVRCVCLPGCGSPTVLGSKTGKGQQGELDLVQ
jgi:hypothetical protein